MKIQRAALEVLVGQAGSAALRVVLSILTARLLGPIARGEYAVFYSQVALFASFAGLGFAQATVYFVSRRRAVGVVFGNDAVLLVGTAVAIVPILWWRSHSQVASGDYGPRPSDLLLWAAVLLALSDSLLSSFLLGEQRFRRYQGNLLLQATAGVLSALLLLGGDRSAERAVTYRVLLEGAVLASLVISLRRSIGGGGIVLQRAAMREHAAFGMRSYIPNLLNVAHSRVHLLLLAQMAGQGAAGVFSVSLLFVELIAMVPNAIGTVMLPRLSAMSDRREAAELSAAVSRHTLLLSVVLFLCLAPAMDWLVLRLFGSEYESAADAARLIALGGVLATPVQVFTRFFTSGAQQRFYTLSIGCGVATAILATTVLVPIAGASGAAWAFVASTTATSVTILLSFRHVSGLPIAACLFVRAGELESIHSRIKRAVSLQREGL